MSFLACDLSFALLICFGFLQDLEKDLRSELGGKLEDLIVALMSPPTIYDANELHKAIKVKSTIKEVYESLLYEYHKVNVYEL